MQNDKNRNLYTYLVLFFDRFLKVLRTHWDNFLTKFFELGSSYLSRVINLYTKTLVWLLRGNRNQITYYPWLFIRAVLIIPLITLFFVPFFMLILFGGLIFSIFGLRNLGRYSFKEQLFTWSLLIFFLVCAPFVLSDYFLYKITLIMVYAVGVIGLNMLLGQCGIISLGQGGFLLTGGYFVTWLAKGILGFELPLALAIVIGALLNAVVGIFLGLPALRVKDNYLVIVTMCFSLATPMLLKSQYLVKLSGARQGGLFLEGNLVPSFLPHIEPHIWQYFYVSIPCLILFFIAYNIIHHSQIGRAFQIIKCDNEVTMIMGIPVVRYKLLAFSLSAIYAGFAGGFFMVLTKFISPDSYSLYTSIDFLVANFIGGVGGLLGSILGGAFLAYDVDIIQYATTIFPKAKDIAHGAYGIILIVIVLFAPLGISGQISKWLKTLFQRSPIRGAFTFNPPPDFDYLEKKKEFFPEKK